MRLILMILLVSALTTGCNKAYFQPPGPTYIYYKKAGATELDVKKAMLECGMSDVDMGSGNFKQDMNTSFLADWCMEQSSFQSTEGGSTEKTCKLEDYRQYPACQPDAVIPKPSVERRLNSEYCKYARSRIDSVRFEKCLKEEVGNPLYTTTTEACIYRYRDLRAECRP